MALINIDDRDVINNFYDNASKQKSKEWLQRLKSELPTSRVNYIHNGLFKIDLPVIISTGSDVEILFNIPFMHELQKMELKHTDTNLVDSNNTLDYSLQKSSLSNTLSYIHQISNVAASDMYDEYSKNYNERCQYLFITNTINTDKLYATFYFLIFGD